MAEPSTPLIEPPSAQPGNLLLEFIITLLTPMFLAVAGGNLAHARAAAAETLGSFRTETRYDLITVTKIIAFGLATISSLSRSMDDDVSLNQILRLRSNANATDRSEHRNRQALGQSPLGQSPPRQSQARQPADRPPEMGLETANLVAAAQQMQHQTAETLAAFSHPVATAPTPPQPTGSTAENHYAATWAASAAQIAAETAASLDGLPPDERRGAAIWVGVLNDLANDFTRNGIPLRPDPGGLDGLFRAA